MYTYFLIRCRVSSKTGVGCEIMPSLAISFSLSLHPSSRSLFAATRRQGLVYMSYYSYISATKVFAIRRPQFLSPWQQKSVIMSLGIQSWLNRLVSRVRVLCLGLGTRPNFNSINSSPAWACIARLCLRTGRIPGSMLECSA